MIIDRCQGMVADADGGGWCFWYNCYDNGEPQLICIQIFNYLNILYIQTIQIFVSKRYGGHGDGGWVPPRSNGEAEVSTNSSPRIRCSPITQITQAGQDHTGWHKITQRHHRQAENNYYEDASKRLTLNTGQENMGHLVQDHGSQGSKKSLPLVPIVNSNRSSLGFKRHT